MKIVTAGQRGSVATEDEIRKKRHNKRRLFSYSLILLFSAIGGFAANGAKLCRMNLYKKTHAWQNGVTAAEYGRWSIGDGCGDAAKSDANQDAWCATTIIRGRSGCFGKGWAFDDQMDVYKATPGGGGICMCQVQYPYTGLWLVQETQPSAYSCNLTCASECANDATESESIWGAVLVAM